MLDPKDPNVARADRMLRALDARDLGADSVRLVNLYSLDQRVQPVPIEMLRRRLVRLQEEAIGHAITQLGRRP